MQSLLKLEGGIGEKGVLDAHLVWFGEGRAWTYNAELGRMVTLPDELKALKGACDGKRLLHFLQRAPDSEAIKVTCKDEKFIAKSGSARITLPWRNETQALPYAEPTEWEELPKELPFAIGFALPCCARHMTRPTLTCVHVTDKYVEASDADRAIRYKLGNMPAKTNHMIPRNAAQALSKANITQWSVQKSAVWLLDDTDTYTFHPIMEGEYPSLDKVLAVPKDAVEFDLPLRDDKAKLDVSTTLDRARLFCDQEDSGEHFVDITMTEGRVWIRAEDAHGKFEERLSLKAKVPDLSFSMNIQHLVDLMERGATAHCAYTEGRLWVLGDKWTYVSAVKVKPSK